MLQVLRHQNFEASGRCVEDEDSGCVQDGTPRAQYPSVQECTMLTLGPLNPVTRNHNNVAKA